jgi:AcrR family transcriptional regulator
MPNAGDLSRRRGAVTAVCQAKPILGSLHSLPPQLHAFIREIGGDIAAGAPGSHCWIGGQVTGTDGRPVPGACIEGWEADEDGFYDVRYADRRVSCRARLNSDGEGGHAFWGLAPSPYPASKSGSGPVDEDAMRAIALAAADQLFYAKGVQAVGMDELRAASGISLKRLYKLFPSKDAIVEQFLLARHRTWTEGLTAAVAREDAPRERLLAVYDFLAAWFTQEDFRGCAFINSFGELGGTSPRVADIVRSHKKEFQAYIAGLAKDIGAPSSLAPQLAILAEGAQTTAAISGSSKPAEHARAAAEKLIDAALLFG